MAELTKEQKAIYDKYLAGGDIKGADAYLKSISTGRSEESPTERRKREAAEAVESEAAAAASIPSSGESVSDLASIILSDSDIDGDDVATDKINVLITCGYNKNVLFPNVETFRTAKGRQTTEELNIRDEAFVYITSSSKYDPTFADVTNIVDTQDPLTTFVAVDGGGYMTYDLTSNIYNQSIIGTEDNIDSTREIEVTFSNGYTKTIKTGISGILGWDYASLPYPTSNDIEGITYFGIRQNTAACEFVHPGWDSYSSASYSTHGNFTSISDRFFPVLNPIDELDENNEPTGVLVNPWGHGFPVLILADHHEDGANIVDTFSLDTPVSVGEYMRVGDTFCLEDAATVDDKCFYYQRFQSYQPPGDNGPDADEYLINTTQDDFSFATPSIASNVPIINPHRWNSIHGYGADISWQTPLTNTVSRHAFNIYGNTTPDQVHYNIAISRLPRSFANTSLAAGYLSDTLSAWWWENSGQDFVSEDTASSYLSSGSVDNIWENFWNFGNAMTFNPFYYWGFSYNYGDFDGISFATPRAHSLLDFLNLTGDETASGSYDFGPYQTSDAAPVLATLNTPFVMGTVGGNSIFTNGTVLSNKIPTPTTLSVQFAKSLPASCAPEPVTFEVCTDPSSPSYYITTSQDCNGNTIPADNLNGTIPTTFTTGDCCAVDCSGFNSTVTVGQQPSYNTANGQITVQMSASADGTPTMGNPSGTGSAYTYTISHPSNTITQTAPPTLGNVVTKACATTNNVNIITVNSADDQVTSGMRVTGTGIPDNSYVGEIYAGNIGSDAAGVTQFYLVDINGGVVDATATNNPVTLTFSATIEVTFGSLPDSGGDPYILTVTDSDGCSVETGINLQMGPAPEGCTDSGALNYDASAVLDDGSCAICEAITGTIIDSVGNVIYENGILGNGPNPATISGNYGVAGISNNVLAGNNTGELTFNFPLNPLAIDALVNTMTYTITLYSYATENDALTNSGATQVAQTTGITQANGPNATFSTLGYGFYRAKIEIEDSATGADAGIEKCFGWSQVGLVLAAICTDTTSDTYADYIAAGVPADLWNHDPSLCTYSCDFSVNLLYMPDPDLCLDGQIKAEVNYNNFNNHNLTLQLFENGNLIQTETITGFNGNQIFSWDVLQYQGGGINLVPLQSGVNTYEVVIVATNQNSTCTASAINTFTIPACGCMDPTAVNFNIDANSDCYGIAGDTSCCIYETYSCDQDTFTCFDPGDNSGQYASLADCESFCSPPPPAGCTDPLADNYDVAAVIDDGSCIYTACLDPLAIQIPGSSGQFYNCNGDYLPQATNNDLSCCLYCAGNEPIVVATPTDVTGTSCQPPSPNGTITVTVTSPPGDLDCPTNSIQLFSGFPTIANLLDTVGNIDSGVSHTFTGLQSGVYTIIARNDCYSCITTTTITIGSNIATCGCTDPGADNYDPSATIDDGSCLYCGCTDPLADNYDPNASCDDGSCVYTPPANPCQLQVDEFDKVEKTISKCLADKGTVFLNKLKAGLIDDCSIMNHWKLILVHYLMNTQNKELSCLYNCQDTQSIDDFGSVVPTCADQLATGGPTTGLNDAGYPGSTYTPGIGTVITDPSAYFVQTTIVWEGDVIQMPSGNIYVMVAGVNSSQGGYNPESSQGQQSGHWQLCQPTSDFSPTNADGSEASVAYLDKFTNFANKFCADCNTDFKA